MAVATLRVIRRKRPPQDRFPNTLIYWPQVCVRGMLLSPQQRAAGHAGGGTNRRERAQPIHEWELLLPLFAWLEQERYEQIRPLVLFDVAVADRAAEVGTSASTLSPTRRAT
jgi:hypothetical protein